MRWLKDPTGKILQISGHAQVKVLVWRVSSSGLITLSKKSKIFINFIQKDFDDQTFAQSCWTRGHFNFLYNLKFC